MQIEDSTTAALLHITNTGSVGIGASPLTPLHVKGGITSSGGQIRVDANASNSNAALSLFSNRAGSLFESARLIGTYNGALQGQLQFYTNDGTGNLVQRGMFDETGSFAIGGTPTKRLDVITSTSGDVATFRTTASSGQGVLLGVDTTNSRAYLRLNTSSTYSYAILDISGNPLVSFNNSDGKTYFGSVLDTNLYRTGAGSLKTDGSFTVGTNMTVTGSLTTGSLNFTGGSVSGSLTVTQDITARNGGATQVLVGSVAANAGLSFGSAGDTNLYRSTANTLKTDDALIITIGAQLISDAGTATSGIRFGSAADTTLYRSTSGTLKTDGALVVSGAATTAALTASSVSTTGNLSFQSRTASDLSLINSNSDGTLSIRLNPSGTPTDILTISSIGNVTLPATAANATPTIVFGAETLYRQVAGTLKTDSIFNAVGGFKVNGTALAASHLSNGVTGSGSVVLSASPTLTGAPVAPTAAADTNTTQVATTAYVIGQASSTTPLADGNTAAVGSSTRFARADHVHPLSGQSLNDQGTSYTFVLTDRFKLVRSTSGGAVTFTVPANASQAFSIGDSIDLLQYGAGQVTLSPAGGVTLVGNPGLKTNGTYTMVSLVKVGTDTWVVVGNLTT